MQAGNFSTWQLCLFFFFFFAPLHCNFISPCHPHRLFFFQNNSYPRLRKWRQNKLRRNIMTSRSRGCEVMTLKEMEPKLHLERRREFSFYDARVWINTLQMKVPTELRSLKQVLRWRSLCLFAPMRVIGTNGRGKCWRLRRRLNERRFFIKTQGFRASVLLSQHLLIYDLLLRAINTANSFFNFL